MLTSEVVCFGRYVEKKESLEPKRRFDELGSIWKQIPDCMK